MEKQQKALSLTLSRNNGETFFNFNHRQRDIDGKNQRDKTPDSKLFADLLKRQARRIMQDVTCCNVDTISIHVARLDDIREQIRFALNHYCKETPESNLSDFPLNSTYTLADHLAAIEHTRKSHRCPAFANWRDAEIKIIHDKIDTLAGLLSTPELQARLLAESEAFA